MSFSLREPKRIFITLAAVIFMGVSVSVLNLVNLGVDPYTYMNLAISEKIGWTFGNWQILINAVLFIPVIIWGRDQIGFGTIFNMVLVGYTVDFCSWIWELIGLPALLKNTIVLYAAMVIALAVFIFAAATYMSTGLGTSPFDAPPLIISKHLKKVPFKVIRFCWDLTAVIVGFAFSFKLGIVTVLMTFFLGATVEFVKNKWFKT